MGFGGLSKREKPPSEDPNVTKSREEVYKEIIAKSKKMRVRVHTIPQPHGPKSKFCFFGPFSDFFFFFCVFSGVSICDEDLLMIPNDRKTFGLYSLRFGVLSRFCEL